MVIAAIWPKVEEMRGGPHVEYDAPTAVLALTGIAVLLSARYAAEQLWQDRLNRQSAAQEADRVRRSLATALVVELSFLEQILYRGYRYPRSTTADLLVQPQFDAGTKITTFSHKTIGIISTFSASLRELHELLVFYQKYSTLAAGEKNKAANHLFTDPFLVFDPHEAQKIQSLASLTAVLLQHETNLRSRAAVLADYVPNVLNALVAEGAELLASAAPQKTWQAGDIITFPQNPFSPIRDEGRIRSLSVQIPSDSEDTNAPRA